MKTTEMVPVGDLTQRIERITRQRVADATKPLTERIESQNAEIARLRAQLAAYEDQGARTATKSTRRMSFGNRGRSRAQDVIKQDGIVYWSVAYTAQITKLSQSTISRRATNKAISYILIGGTYYINAASASSLSHKSKNARR